MLSPRSIQTLRNCLTVLGTVFTPATLFEKASGVTMAGYVWVGLAFICLLTGILWSMHEREAALIKEAEDNFFRKFPEYRDYKNLWFLHGLLSKARSLLANHGGGTALEFIAWKTEVRLRLEQWSEIKLNTYQRNLANDADLKRCAEKLAELLEDETRPLG